MKQPVFEGVATALVTPFKNGTIDYPTLHQLLDFQIDSGIDAIVVCGTTGEAATMTMDEQLGVIADTVQYVAKRCKVIAGTGSNSTAHCLELSRVASSIGADALLLVTPYYNKCTQSGLIRHYCLVADAVKTPVIVYNVPSRTGMDITVDTYRVLGEHPNICGVKEASGCVSKASRIRNVCGDALHIWSGNDDDAVAMMAAGAKGLISVLSNVRPKQVLDMIKSCQRGEYARAGALQAQMMPLIDALFSEVNPIAVKEAMMLIGFDCGDPRPPLTRLSEENRNRLKMHLN